MGAVNDYNYVRVSRLEPISIEALALVVASLYFLYLVYKKQANWDIAYFLCLPFTDDPFRIGSLQPVEVLSLFLIAFNYRKLRLNYVILIGCTFILFSGIGFLTGNVHGTYSPLYSIRFLLIGLVFSVFKNQPFRLPVSVMRFVVIFSFAMTFLQAALWLAGLPVHGIFYNGVLPRTKGLAHEPATWSIWIVTLFPFILHFKLGRPYLILNFLMLLLTFSTFGTLATLTFFVIRWVLTGAHFRLRKSALRFAAVALVLALGVVVVKPDTLGSASKLLTVFNKLVLYQQEITKIATGQSGDAVSEGPESGRSEDLTYLQNTFPDHWLAGVGSFNAPYDPNDPNFIPGTNTYLVMPAELGLAGMTLIVLLFLMHYRTLLRDRRQKSVDFLAYSLNFLLMIAGIRCFSFYEPWYAQATLLRLPREAEAEAVETPPATQWGAVGSAATEA